MRTRLLGAAGLAGASAVGGALGLSSYFARRFVTPEPPEDDVVIRELTASTITLDADEQTTAPGRYGLWLNGPTGHLRFADVLARTDTTVTRVLEAVDFGEPLPGAARMNGYYHAGPPASSLGIPLEDVSLPGPLGAMPGWQVRGQDPARWAVLVHGRGALRAECLRAVPTLHDLGFNVLIPSYRNDIDAPASDDGRYHLGLSEWEDVEAALIHAVELGAQEIVLFGWSMGGAAVLQTLDRSWLSERVSRVVLDAPVVDWAAVMAFHARENRLPAPLGRLGGRMMRGPAAGRLLGLVPGIDLAHTNWVARAAELHTPILLIHSTDDEFVPVGRSQELARARPDLVTMPEWTTARHCREWNTEPGRWERMVREFLAPPA
ncbi:alpha/beta hydrolase family protein [Leekyejoonella antrihumi]|uniref:Alpha/beta fold hydrolase n=1 Tax=Leekyejoonella antrihumi TaxID=1660198 RepID=A0A563E1R4_9MICO|nr:alpha/beta fold hydrolase [Leekyejoonella antrihumi]TWP35844.1 alpha/beta fold hydrolase [Leekyejoonella antrihumi]